MMAELGDKLLSHGGVMETTARVNWPLALNPLESVTVTVKARIPSEFMGGVPMSKPAGPRVSHAGNPVADQIYPVVAGPDAVNV